MKIYTHEELIEEEFGPIGTPERDEYERTIRAYQLGDAVKRARIEKKITQEELGNLAGVRKGLVSRIETGKDAPFSSITKIFDALQIKFNLILGDGGVVSI